MIKDTYLGNGSFGSDIYKWTHPSTYNNDNASDKDASSENEKKPSDCPSGTLDIDKAKKKFGWDKDTLHGIKDAAHGGLGTGKSWTGVAPDGTVGINEGGKKILEKYWTPIN